MTGSGALILVDGSSYLYRAFHALPELTNKTGEPTGAVHGVLNMLNKLVRDTDPTHLAVIFDAPGKTFRDDLYKDYKANRPPMPDDLRAQVEPLLSAIEANGWPLLRIAGVEADDVIGTLAKRAATAGMPVIIVTGDKDMAQLVNDHVSLLDTMPRGPSRKPRATDAAGVIERFGVRADQIIDYLALVGDSSDNIPGVPKVGAKTAVALLEHFDHVDDILANLEGVAELPVRGAKGLASRIEENRELLLLSHELATIRTDLDLDSDPAALKPGAPDIDALRVLYERLELRRLLDGLSDEPSSDSQSSSDRRSSDEAAMTATAVDIETDYETIFTTDQLDAWLERIGQAELVGFDT